MQRTHKVIENVSTSMFDSVLCRLEKANNGCWVWPGAKNPTGYGIKWYNGRTILVHRLMYAFVYNYTLTNEFVLHACDNPSCCNPAHLSIGTLRENNEDRSAKGRSADMRGENHHNAKLTWVAVDYIRDAYKNGMSQVDLAKQFGVSSAMVSGICKYRYWVRD